MSKTPTAMELLAQINGNNDGPWLSASLALAARVEAVLALHCEFKVYDAIDPADFSDATYLYTCCRECHTDDGETNEWSDEGKWPCATVRALNGEP